MKLKIQLQIYFIILLSFSCSDNITKPEPEPGRRNYSWTIDTINVSYPIGKIWGSSPTDVWCINESDFNHSIWHYDGNKWSTDGIHRFVSPHALWGFSHDNVYIGGINGKIWKFDGSNWRQVTELTKEGTDFIAFENIWGESPNNFFVVGNGPDENQLANHSVIVHFAFNNWTMLNTDNLIGDVVHLYKNKPDNKIYFRLTKIGGTKHIDSTIIYEYAYAKYHKIYSSLETMGYQADISLIDENVYFILGNEIAKRQNGQFDTIFYVDNPNFYHRIWGRNSKDIFLLMTDGLVHYNGTNMEYLYKFTYPDAKPATQIFDAAIFEHEVFFATYEPPTHLKLIYHGILTEQ
ncbi:MAG: hypothetical protein JXR46_14365 [Calditrichaceae bacterium]|nr:hypothetical protein [Calditrichaceae bacterium]MBN2710223.1 hypothetical protein [Calditrichaceae bacterium]RQV96596.1 MAG: hypothetical protein EH224_04000 [Calditrichota bacterium]